MADSQSMKTCARCKQDKSTLEFYRNKQTKDGLQVYCKPCSKIINDASLKKPKKCRRCKQPRDKNDGVHGVCSKCLDYEAHGLFVCTKCKTPKPREEFVQGTGDARGFTTKCKLCWADASLAKYYTDSGRESQLVRTKKYNTKEIAKEKARVRNRQQKLANPIKYAARTAIKYAIRRKQMPPASELKCAHCGGQAQQYHHHHGYKPEFALDVIPLCTRCHGLEHADSTYALRKRASSASTTPRTDISNLTDS